MWYLLLCIEARTLRGHQPTGEYHHVPLYNQPTRTSRWQKKKSATISVIHCNMELSVKFFLVTREWPSFSRQWVVQFSSPFSSKSLDGDVVMGEVDVKAETDNTKTPEEIEALLYSGVHSLSIFSHSLPRPENLHFSSGKNQSYQGSSSLEQSPALHLHQA